jgi:hypothetical protein
MLLNRIAAEMIRLSQKARKDARLGPAWALPLDIPYLLGEQETRGLGLGGERVREAARRCYR